MPDVRPLFLLFCVVACAQETPVRRDTVAATPSSASVITTVPEDSITLTVRAYFDALERHDLAAAGSLREDSAAFAKAHGGSDIRNVEIGTPGAMEGAAGSRYVTVPVTFDDSVPGKPVQRMHENVTLRKAEVDGATPEQRRWHIYQIQAPE